MEYGSDLAMMMGFIQNDLVFDYSSQDDLDVRTRKNVMDLPPKLMDESVYLLNNFNAKFAIYDDVLLQDVQ